MFAIVMLLKYWQYALIALLVAAVGVQTHRLASETAAFNKYEGGVVALGHAAQIAKDKTEAVDKLRKETADDKIKVARVVAAPVAARVRDDASRSSLPGPAPVTGDFERACFNRADLDAALRRFTEGTAELAIEGSAAVTDLNAVKEWAK